MLATSKMDTSSCRQKIRAILSIREAVKALADRDIDFYAHSVGQAH